MDAVVAFIELIFRLPQTFFDMPEHVKEYVQDSSARGPFLVVSPAVFEGYEIVIKTLYLFQNFAWFASLMWWFLIAFNLFLVLEQTMNLQRPVLCDEFNNHLAAWSLSSLYIITLYFAVTPKASTFTFPDFDWVVLEIVVDSEPLFSVFFYVCIMVLLFGVAKSITAVVRLKFDIRRSRIALFIFLALVLWLPMVAGFFLDRPRLMTVTLSALGIIHGYGYVTSPEFRHCFFCWIQNGPDEGYSNPSTSESTDALDASPKLTERRFFQANAEEIEFIDVL